MSLSDAEAERREKEAAERERLPPSKETPEEIAQRERILQRRRKKDRP